jgi:hypothetical protein
MTHDQQTAVKTGSADQRTLLVNLIKELVDTCEEFRPIASATSPQQRDMRLRGAVLRLDALCERWDKIGFVEIVRAIRRELNKILEHSQAILSGEDISTQLFMCYLGLENIPSQLTAALEQALINDGSAPTRYRLINEIFRLKSGSSYLEIGCCSNDCFKEVKCSQKVGVDPNSGGTLRMTSDEFFAVNQQVFDLVFIDGLHEATQVDKDIANALRWTSDNGIIVLHDCNPLFEVRSIVPRIAETWNGDVWKSLVRVRSRLDIDCATGIFDHGCAVICKRPNSAPINPLAEEDLTWPNLQANRSAWLRLMPYEDLVMWLSKQ